MAERPGRVLLLLECSVVAGRLRSPGRRQLAPAKRADKGCQLQSGVAVWVAAAQLELWAAELAAAARSAMLESKVDMVRC